MCKLAFICKYLMCAPLINNKWCVLSNRIFCDKWHVYTVLSYFIIISTKYRINNQNDPVAFDLDKKHIGTVYLYFDILILCSWYCYLFVIRHYIIFVNGQRHVTCWFANKYISHIIINDSLLKYSQSTKNIITCMHIIANIELIDQNFFETNTCTRYVDFLPGCIYSPPSSRANYKYTKY